MIRNGNVYIERASFTKAHGASPSTAEGEAEAQMYMPLQQFWHIQIGASIWNGIVVDVQDIKRESSGLTTRIRAVDLRDYLFSDAVFAKINMIDPNTGEIYSVIPDFDGVEFINDFPVYGHVYPRDLIDFLLEIVGFDADYSAAALNILRSVEGDDWQNSRYNVFDLDWYNGVKIGTAVSQVAELLGLQFTVVPNLGFVRRLRFTVIGEPDYPFLEWEGIFATETAVGEALQTDVDTGIWIVGEKNLYEYTDVPCVAAWNQEWNQYWPNYRRLSEAVQDAGGDPLTTLVSEFLPDEGFIGGRSRNDPGAIIFNNLTVAEYWNKILYKVYRIDIMDQFLSAEELSGQRPVLERPILGPLLSNPGKDYILKARHIDKKSKSFQTKFISNDRIEMEGGHTLDENNGFIVFEHPQYEYTPPAIARGNPGDEELDYIPDTPMITCVFLQEVFRRFYGDSERVGSKHVPGLRQSFMVNPYDAVDGVEFIRDGEKAPDYMSEDIALGILSRKRVVRSGEETFVGISGHEPTGEIRRVSVSVDPDRGISERVSYSNDEPNIDVEPHIETQRKIAQDVALRESNLKKRENDLARLKDMSRYFKRSELLADESTQAALHKYNKDNYVEVENTEGTTVVAGDPVIAVPGTSGDFATIPVAQVVSEDKRTVGIALSGTTGGPIKAVTTGITKAKVTGPCVAGDTLSLDLASNTLKKGVGSFVAMADQPSATPALIAVKIGGGGGGESNSATARVASTANVAVLSGVGTFDGVTLVADDVILLKDQTDKTKNDLWTIKAGAWTRTGELVSGLIISVREGTNSGGATYICITNDPLVIGTTLIDFRAQVQDSFYSDIASTANLPLTGTAAVDGQAIAGKRILAKNQTIAADRGLYQVPSSGGGAWTKIGQPKVVDVLTGTTNGRTRWLLTAANTYSGGYDFYA